MSAFNGPTRADYVIVGGGSAGLVLANRLSEDPGTEVILIEAGGEAKSLLVQLPAGYARLVGHSSFDWKYEQAADPTMANRRHVWSAGKLLGGSSSINGQVYIRAGRNDLDAWVREGATGWGFDELLPYYIRSEHWYGRPSQFHGAFGPLAVTPPRHVHPLAKIFIRGCQELGLPFLDDYHTGDMDGVYYTATTQRDGWRCSAEKAYLRPARNRPNLHVVTGAEVKTVRTHERRAIGVSVTLKSERIDIDAIREVIVSAGAMGSPALLLRSGIGPAAYLAEAGIPIELDLSGVGQNLQEHPTIGIHRFINQPSLNSQTGPFHLVGHALRFLWNRSGPLGLPVVPAMGLARTNDDLEEPDVQLHFTPVSWETGPDGESRDFGKSPAVSIFATICHPHSRGHIILGEQGRPRVMHQFFSDERDLETLVDACNLIERIYDAPALAALVTGYRIPSSPLPDRTAWAQFVRTTSGQGFHPVGTCRMGAGEGAVVDSALRVRGMEALRVVDASIMPQILSANTNATTMAIGEKASDLIRGR